MSEDWMTRRLRTQVQHPETGQVLRRILEHERDGREQAEEKGRKYLGWKPGEIPIPKAVHRKLASQGIVQVAYDSSNHTQYVLTDPGATQQLLEDHASEAGAGRGQVSNESAALYRQWAKQGPVLERLARHIAPHVHGLDRAKQALLLALASPSFHHHARGRIHVLLHGPPGTAKTELLLWAAKLTRTSVYSPRLTEAGLTVNLRTGEPGALARAHHDPWQLVVVDEIEKVPKTSLHHTLQALEEGRFSWESGETQGTFPAQVRLLAAANDLGPLPEALRDRIDLTIHVPQPTPEEAKPILDHIVDSWGSPGREKGLDWVRGYLRWARQHEPTFPEGVREEVKEMLHELVDARDRGEVRIRDYEPVLRLAWTTARLNRTEVGVEHVVEAVRLLFPRQAII